MSKRLLVLALGMVGGLANAKWTDRYEVKDGRKVKIRACDNGVSFVIAVEPDKLVKGAWLPPETKNEPPRYSLRFGQRKIEGRYFRTVDVFDAEERKWVDQIILDHHPLYGVVRAEDFPVRDSEAGEESRMSVHKSRKARLEERLRRERIRPEDEAKDSQEKHFSTLTGLTRQKHYDARSQETFEVWHLLEDEAVEITPAPEGEKVRARKVQPEAGSVPRPD